MDPGTLKNVFFHFVFVKTRKLKISYGEKIKQTTNNLNIEKKRKSQKDTNKTITKLKKRNSTSFTNTMAQ